MVTVPAASQAFIRVYVDITGEANAQLEALAQKNGRTKKGQLQMLIAEAIEKENAPKRKSK